MDKALLEKENMDNDDNNDGSDQKNICSICLESLLNQQEHYIHESCGGNFHIFCIDRWIVHLQNKNNNNVSCPRCRDDLNKHVEETAELEQYRQQLSKENDDDESRIEFNVEQIMIPYSFPPLTHEDFLIHREIQRQYRRRRRRQQQLSTRENDEYFENEITIPFRGSVTPPLPSSFPPLTPEDFLMHQEIQRQYRRRRRPQQLSTRENDEYFENEITIPFRESLPPPLSSSFPPSIPIMPEFPLPLNPQPPEIFRPENFLMYPEMHRQFQRQHPIVYFS